MRSRSISLRPHPHRAGVCIAACWRLHCWHFSRWLFQPPRQHLRPWRATCQNLKPAPWAPQFTLKDQNGKTQKLSDYKGKWVVVYFYPKDQTPGCTSQACSFTDNVFAFRKANAQILGISVDDEASHKEFEKVLSGAASDKLNAASKASIDKLSEETKKDIAEHGLPFPLLADSTMATAKSYGGTDGAWHGADGQPRYVPDRSCRQGGQALRCHG